MSEIADGQLLFELQQCCVPFLLFTPPFRTVSKGPLGAHKPPASRAPPLVTKRSLPCMLSLNPDKPVDCLAGHQPRSPTSAECLASAYSPKGVMSFAQHARGTMLLRRPSCHERSWQHRPAMSGMAPSRPSHRRIVRMATSSDKINTTLADLDAMLGIEEKKEEEQEQAKPVEVSIAPEVVAQLAEAEKKRAANMEPQNSRAVQQQIDRLTEQARRLAQGGEGKPGEERAGDAALRKEFEALANMLGTGQGISHDDVKTIKESVFKRTAFWVTETKALPGVLGGILVRGNLKAPAQQVFDEVVAGTREVLGEKYIVRVVPDAAALEDDFGSSQPAAGSPPRVSFEFLPAATCAPPEMARWQRVAAGVLLLLTLGSTFQLAVGANIGLLPKETLLWLANPANLDPLNEGIIPPGLEDFDPLPFFKSLADVCLVTLLPQLAHELGHTVAAALKRVKIGASFLIPNSQLGTFGSVTQLKSYVRNRADLFDFALSGLGAGGVVSLGLFIAGLSLSHGGNTPEPGLVPVPSQLFQGSLFLGGLARLTFGSDVISHVSVYVHPMLIGGWCGLVTTAFNALPVGNLDGGRSMLASFGRNGLAVSSFLTYIGLGLSLLGSSLAWPFGIYLLICQREAEKYVQDEVTVVGERRQAVSAALIVLAILVLLPMAPEVADTVGVGTPADFL